jgi:hypothetical protein
LRAQIEIATGILRHICPVKDNARFKINCPCLRKLFALNNKPYNHFSKQLGKEERERERVGDIRRYSAVNIGNLTFSVSYFKIHLLQFKTINDKIISNYNTALYNKFKHFFNRFE